MSLIFCRDQFLQPKKKIFDPGTNAKKGFNVALEKCHTGYANG